MSVKHEYAYDIKMFAVIRILARNKKEAEKILDRALEKLELEIDNHINDELLKESIELTAIYVDDAAGPYLFEVDGKSTEF